MLPVPILSTALICVNSAGPEDFVHAQEQWTKGSPS